MPWPGFSFLALTTRPSFRAQFKAGDGGKTAVYMTRWVNTRGEKGPWSEVAAATVAAKDSGLRALTSLCLNYTKITDVGTTAWRRRIRACGG